MFGIILLLISLFGCGNCLDRRSSAPYISGDTFRAHADHIFDDSDIPFSPEKVRPGDVIFLKTDLLEPFFQMHPLIASPYILVTQNADRPIPEPFAYMLEDKKLLAWFGQNVENYSHPKLHPIPLGIANRYWAHGNTQIFDEVYSQLKNHPKIHLLYLNFTISTCPKERSLVYRLFVDQPFCTVSPRKDFRSYLIDTARSKFILSPRGNGIDCHRTWEALHMGAIPIVRTSSIDPIFEGLPVLIVKDWSEITEEFLEKKYEEMQNQTYDWDKLNAAYWRHLIHNPPGREGS